MIRTHGSLDVQRELTGSLKAAQAAGDLDEMVRLAQAKLALARACRGTSCRSCAHWRAQERRCALLDTPATPIQGCGYHSEVVQ